MIHAHQDRQIKPHMVCQLEGDICNGETLEDAPGESLAEILFTGEVRVKISQVRVISKPPAGAPGEKFWHCEPIHLSRTLLKDQVVHRDEIGGGKAQLGEAQVDAVLP